MFSVEFLYLIPIMILGIGAFYMLALSLIGIDFSKSRSARTLFGSLICLSALVVSALHIYANVGDSNKEVVFNGMVCADTSTFFLFTIILIGTLFTLWINHGQLVGQRVSNSIDVDVLILLTALGCLVMVSSIHLVSLFVGIEITSIGAYILTCLARKEESSSEGALKYFILGAFSSAFMLYGFSILYGATGALRYEQIRIALMNAPAPLTLIAFSFVALGMCFKVGAAPFHFWVPDAYQGAPVSLSGFMASVIKVAAFGAFLRFIVKVFLPLRMDLIGHSNLDYQVFQSQILQFQLLQYQWQYGLCAIAVCAMVIGNFVAIKQNSVKRMLAYSSIAHAGYILLGFVALHPDVAGIGDGVTAVLFYLLTYAFATLGAFGVVLLVTSGTDAQYGMDDISSFRGVGWRSPLIGFSMTVFMCSLAGVPPFAGFVSKLFLLCAIVKDGYIVIAIIAALNSVVSLFYYLRVVVVMFFYENNKYENHSEDLELYGMSYLPPQCAVIFAMIVTIVLGVFSSWFFDLAAMAARSMS